MIVQSGQIETIADGTVNVAKQFGDNDRLCPILNHFPTSPPHIAQTIQRLPLTSADHSDISCGTPTENATSPFRRFFGNEFD